MSARKYDGVGGFAKDSYDIPLIAWPSVVLGIMALASVWRIAVWIVQN